MIRNAASERQAQAADPGASTWLSANAGSGKTRVLTDRVARLLLNGVPPQRILCLTYTKAAASEMQNRLFRRLGEWAMLDADQLRHRLLDLGLDQNPDEKTLRQARRLFARAIETPGGLKIQTIHSFCAGLLRRFPLEAGVSPQFVEMDDRAAKRLREEILEHIAEQDTAAFDAIAAHYTGDDLAGLTAEISRHRAAFDAADPGMIWARFGLRPGVDAPEIIGRVFIGGEAELIDRLLPALHAGSANDVKAAARLSALNLTVPGLPELSILEDVLLTGASAKQPFSAKIGSFPTKATREGIADILPVLESFMLRVEAARGERVALAAAQRSVALHQFAAAFLPEYARRKQRRGWLDFDDLILKARDLLTDPGIAEWVLFRLDGGIDHVLVDEAQDTSPVQWQVIDLLTREFTAGQGARGEMLRTIFVVGDKKQSIYSFQGAEPDGFDRMRESFGARLVAAGGQLRNLQLEYSFRSSEAVLRVVDNTFHSARRQGMGDDVLHRAFRAEMPGRVDLWPIIEASKDPDPPHWADPVDILASTHHMVQLAERIAAEIKRLIEVGESIQGNGGVRRKIKAGDFLILVQRRSALFHEIIRACKSAGLPIAGADRLKVGGELAVKDLTALLSFLATPEDSLSLAAALRSPLFGWDEGMIYDIAAGRDEKFLWATLRNRKQAYTETVQVLSALLDDADFLRPYDLIERILTRHDGRRRLIARLGPEAQDGIDALLSLALGYERTDIPSLTGFLSWLATEEVEIKRQADSAGDRIRVMTVHGAKGLEAPVVILPDSGKRDIRLSDEILLAPAGGAIWKTAATDSPPVIERAREALRQRQEEERQRLLYVAMTRAEQWLIVCAAGDLANGESWYERIDEGLSHVGAVAHDFGFGLGRRHATGDWGPPADMAPDRPETPAPALPGWALRRVSAPTRLPGVLTPSDLGGEKIVAGAGGLDEEAAMRRGRQLHILLEHLPGCPPYQRATRAATLLAGDQDWASGLETAALLAEIEPVLDDPALADLFASDTLAEVGITAELPDGGRIFGTIDRLIIGPDRVLAVDFKSNAQVPIRAEDVPDGLLRQMGAYRAALARLYPDKQIDTAILWTRTAILMPLPSQLVADAFGRATIS